MLIDKSYTVKAKHVRQGQALQENFGYMSFVPNLDFDQTIIWLLKNILTIVIILIIFKKKMIVLSISYLALCNSLSE